MRDHVRDEHDLLEGRADEPDDPDAEAGGDAAMVHATRACPHENTTEGVDEDGQLIEPAFDVCLDCGEIIH